MIIAIQPDNYTTQATPDKCDASSPRWAELLERAGHEVRWVNVYLADILDQLQGCQGFMWRWGHVAGMYRIARRLLPVVEKELGLAVYPDQNTCWHYDDKIAERYLLEAAGIPIPRTWIWFDAAAAAEWARSAEYPLVLKLHAGAGSTNVRLVHSCREAEAWVRRLFDRGVYDLTDNHGKPRIRNWQQTLRAAAKTVLRGEPWRDPSALRELHRGYALFQEFLPNNDFDTRVTVIGNRAFGFRRFNRPNDFRASGSGNIDMDPGKVDLATVRLAFLCAQRLKTQSVAIDGLRRGDDRLIGEISYTYVSWVVHDCPGHWILEGSPESGDLVWRDGPVWPEEAQIADFLPRLGQTRGVHGT